MAQVSPADNQKLEDLIVEASASGGSERANYQLFLTRLAEALGLEQPHMASEENQRNDYVFERRVDFKHPNGTTTPGFIDLYKRGCLILEAKQSAKRVKKNPDQLDLMPEDALQVRAGHAKRGTRGWDQVMLAARKQAEDYARALPVEHGYPPFLLIADVGHVIEVYADFSGQGKTTRISPTGAPTGLIWMTCATRTFNYACAPSGPTRIPSIQPKFPPQLPETLPSGWPISLKGWKGNMMRATWPNSSCAACSPCSPRMWNCCQRIPSQNCWRA